MAPENNGGGLSQEFNEAVGETYLSGEFNGAAQGDATSMGAVDSGSSGDEQISGNHDLESDLYSLGSDDDSNELSDYQSFADEMEANDLAKCHDGVTFQEFQEDQASNDEVQEFDETWGSPKNDPDLSM